jgi:hypothetical protein
MIENTLNAILESKRYIKREAKRILVRFGTSDLKKGAFTRNVSETGMCLQTNAVYGPGTKIRVQFDLENRTFSMLARVIWAKTVPSKLAHVRRCGMGICFIEPPLDWIQYYNKRIRKSF